MNRPRSLFFTAALIFLASISARAGGVIVDFDHGKTDWTIKGEGVKIEVVTASEHVKEGSGAAKLELDYDAPYSSAISFPVPPETKAAKESELSFTLFGDASKASFQISLVASDGGVFSTTNAVDWDGWKTVGMPLKDFVFNKFAGAAATAAQEIDPAKIQWFRFEIYSGLQAGGAKHTFYLDSLKFTH